MMVIKSGLFNSINGDRRYKAEDFAAYFATFISNGVFPNPSTGLQVTAGTGMNVYLKPGKAWIYGYYLTNDADYYIPLDVADGVLKRIDRIVLRLTYADREIVPVLKKGVFSSTPVAPTIQRDADAYELVLADVYVANGVLEVIQADITDQRLNTTLCGIVHGLVDQVDTTTIFNQYQSWFNETKFTNEAELDLWMEQEQLNFNTWFVNIQNQLSGDVAGNLQNQISQHISNDTWHVRFGEDTGTENSKIVTLDPIPTSLSKGLALSFENLLENTGPATLNINNLGAKPIIKSDGMALSSGNLKSGSIYTVRYSGTSFILQGEGGGISSEEKTGLLTTVNNIMNA